MSDKINDEIMELFRTDQTQVGDTFRLMEEGVTKPADLVERGAAANTGVISHHKYIIRAVVEGKTYTNSANLASYARRAIDRLLDSPSGKSISNEARELLIHRRNELIGIIGSKEAILNDTKELIEESFKLEEQIKSISNAIYVYTFPTYYRAGVDGDPNVRWLKIGLTTNTVWQRLVEQNRQTSMPEDPILIRVYHKNGIDLKSIESKIMETLTRMMHEQSSARYTKTGKEWFATNEDSIDAIAELLGLEIVKFNQISI